MDDIEITGGKRWYNKKIDKNWKQDEFWVGEIKIKNTIFYKAI